MEYSAAQAMADLGLDRRDMISTSDVDFSGRSVRPDSGQTGVVNNADTARRARLTTAGSSEGGGASALQAWNSKCRVTHITIHSANDVSDPANFDRDDVAEQLEDRGSGQSHRAALSASRRYDAQYEATQVRYGEERALFLRDRSNNYVASTTPRKSKQERFFELPRGSSTPRIVPEASSSSGSRASKRGRLVPTPQNPNRARSPRSYGTVRYDPGRKQSNISSLSMSATPQAAAFLREKSGAATQGTRSTTTPSQGVETTIHQPAQRSDAVRTSLPGQFNTATEVSSSSEVAHNPTNPFDIPSQTFTGLARNGAGAHSQVSEPPKHSWHDRLKYTRMAEYHVVNPGPAADAYKKRSADREVYFREAEKSLIKTAFHCAMTPQSQETKGYLQDNKNRQWMFNEAVIAKDFVERDALAEMDAYHANHPHLVPFGKAAKLYFKPKSELSAGPSQQSTSVVESDRKGDATDSTAIVQTMTKESSSVAKANMREMPNSTETDAFASSNGTAVRALGSEGAASVASPQTDVARVEPAEAAAASDAQQNSTSSSQLRSGCEHIENVNNAIVQPKETGVKPSSLISKLEGFAARLDAMGSSTSARGERKLEGIKMVEDGLWVSDEE